MITPHEKQKPIMLDSIVEALQAEVLHAPTPLDEVRVLHVMASDLMSDVLVIDKDKLLLVTSLASDQSIRTAHIIGAVGVVIVNNKNLPDSMLSRARELDIALLRTAWPKFETCAQISRLMMS
jgi:hypothetical protein